MQYRSWSNKKYVPSPASALHFMKEYFVLYKRKVVERIGVRTARVKLVPMLRSCPD